MRMAICLPLPQALAQCTSVVTSPKAHMMFVMCIRDNVFIAMQVSTIPYFTDIRTYAYVCTYVGKGCMYICREGMYVCM